MARDFSKKFYNSKAWQNCRRSFIAYRISIDGGMCERCKTELGYEVHHKIYLSPSNINDAMVTLSWDNLEYLCESCHSREHMGDATATRDDVVFDDKGDLVYSPP